MIAWQRLGIHVSNFDLLRDLVRTALLQTQIGACGRHPRFQLYGQVFGCMPLGVTRQRKRRTVVVIRPAAVVILEPGNLFSSR
ncbi:hypothetical protein D3C74_310620 [compost metagenome]